MFTCKPYEVDSDMPIFPSSEDEPVGLEHFFVEPGYKEDWVSGLLDLEALQIEKCFNIEDITGTFDYDQIKLDTDVVHPQLTEGEGKSPEFQSETSQGISTRVNGANNFGAKDTDGASTTNYGHCKIEFGDKTGELSCKSTSVINSAKSHHYSLLDEAMAKDPHEVFNDMSGVETLDSGNNWPGKHDLSCLENYAEFDSSLNFKKYEVFSDENGDKTAYSSADDFTRRAACSITGAQKHRNMSREQHMKRKRVDGFESLMTSTSDALDEEGKTGKLVSPKRSRKPPRRYIEESLEYELKPCNKKYGLGKKSKDRFLQPKWQKEFPAEQVGSEEDSINVGCIQVPFGLPLEREHPKKSKPPPVQSYGDPKGSRLFESCEKLDVEPLSVESQEDFSEDECVTRNYAPKGNNCRRKRHISWTQEEVVKLVDGIAQCGVGRWTEIKRLLFSSSSHRTSVDLKDKWRNLLRASCTQLQIKEKVDQGRKQSSNYVSDSILWRVRELAVLYPYPRDNRAKVSCTGPAVSSFPAGNSNALVPLSTVV